MNDDLVALEIDRTEARYLCHVLWTRWFDLSYDVDAAKAAAEQEPGVDLFVERAAAAEREREFCNRLMGRLADTTGWVP